MKRKNAENTAKWIFRIAGIYGLLVLTPQYFLVNKISTDTPPPLTHVEYFYGFVGVALVWQLAFLIIASNPSRYRPLMLMGVLEKLSFFIPVTVLFLQSRVPVSVFAFGLIDLTLGILFFIAWMQTRDIPGATSIPEASPG